MTGRSSGQGGVLRRLGGVLLAGFIASAIQVVPAIKAQDPPPDPAAPVDRQEPAEGMQPAEPSPVVLSEDPGRTAGGALRAFMAARDYRTIRELKAVMTPGLMARFEHDSTPFCGKRGIRLSAFDFLEKDLKPPPARTTRTAEMQPAGAGSDLPTYVGAVRSLWEEQGEAVELRAESARIAQQPDGLWRIAGLERVKSERLRFAEAVNGVTTLRLILRAWHRGDLQPAKGHMSAAFLKKHEGREEGLQAIFSNAAGAARHAAYQILSMDPRGQAAVEARVKLYFAPAGEPAALDGPERRLRLVRKGARWLLDAWD